MNSNFKALGLVAALVLTTANGSAQNLIVRTVNPSLSSAFLNSHGVRLIDQVFPAPFALLTVPPGQDPEAFALQIAQAPEIVWAEVDQRMDCVATGPTLVGAIGAGRGSTIATVFDPNSSYQANHDVLSQIGHVRYPWLPSHRQVRVGILDTGLSSRQPILQKAVVVTRDFVGKRSIEDGPTFSDSNANGTVDEGAGHGTMVAGIVHQVAPHAKLVIGRVADSDGTATAWSLVGGIAFAVINDCEVINISLGSLSDIPAVSDVLDYCEQNRVLVVAAGGNSDNDEVVYPARSQKVLTVVGVDHADKKAKFSNYSRRADVTAPSTGIISAWWNGQTGVWSGTSFASPFVAGAVADALRARPAARMLASALHDRAASSGKNIDSLNPAYTRELGLRLQFSRMHERIVAP